MAAHSIAVAALLCLLCMMPGPCSRGKGSSTASTVAGKLVFSSVLSPLSDMVCNGGSVHHVCLVNCCAVLQLGAEVQEMRMDVRVAARQ
jgi:hypothetical protein